ncbi:hypothetical protein CSKR_202862 [Clonorchis sinensis]|nr:hypothetical protein CSKR_202862 [Clonorchis sinensis]
MVSHPTKAELNLEANEQGLEWFDRRGQVSKSPTSRPVGKQSQQAMGTTSATKNKLQLTWVNRPRIKACTRNIRELQPTMCSDCPTTLWECPLSRVIFHGYNTVCSEFLVTYLVFNCHHSKRMAMTTELLKTYDVRKPLYTRSQGQR